MIVVPCFNEERPDRRARLPARSPRTGQVRLLFVDDGSTDGTGRVLARMAEASDGDRGLHPGAPTPARPKRSRRGLLVAVRSGARDGRVLRRRPGHTARGAAAARSGRSATRPDLAGVLGSRVARLGSSIERNALRHYLGRAYATIASMALGITVYDTQCGAKVFRVNDTFVAALAEPFRSSWAFDVELLHRLLRGSAPAPRASRSPLSSRCPSRPGATSRAPRCGSGPALAALLDLVPIARRPRPARAVDPRTAAPAPGPWSWRPRPSTRGRAPTARQPRPGTAAREDAA